MNVYRDRIYPKFEFWSNFDSILPSEDSQNQHSHQAFQISQNQSMKTIIAFGSIWAFFSGASSRGHSLG